MKNNHQMCVADASLPVLVTRKKLAELRKVCLGTVDTLIRMSIIPSIKIPGRRFVRIPLEEALECLDAYDGIAA